MDRPSQRLLERLPLATGQPLIAYGASVGLVIAAMAMRLAVDWAMPVGYPYLSFFPAVILSAFLFGRGPGIVAGVLGGLASWYYFIPPFYTFELGPGVLLSLGFYTLVVTIDIALVHWMQRANRWLVAERERSRILADKSELLFRELQHRVSNNLQVVAALLSLQKRGVSDEQARAALDEASRRLGLIGRIHRQLHDPSGSRLGMSAFLRQLGADLMDAGGKPGVLCSVEADDSIELSADAVVPLALIVAEAVANALEHGFAEQEEGAIAIRLQRVDGGVQLNVADDGRGLPAGFDIATVDSMGLRIASTLARQLGGRFELLNGTGTVARLTLPA